MRAKLGSADARFPIPDFKNRNAQMEMFDLEFRHRDSGVASLTSEAARSKLPRIGERETTARRADAVATKRRGRQS